MDRLLNHRISESADKWVRWWQKCRSKWTACLIAPVLNLKASEVQIVASDMLVMRIIELNGSTAVRSKLAEKICEVHNSQLEL